jgi:signal transduction histidine kinase
VLVIADNGIGISAQALPRIFEPFAQDTQAIGFNGVGLGIGLTVVRELLQALGGSITASSPGSRLGSRFVVTLPRAGAAGRTGPQHLPADHPAAP